MSVSKPLSRCSGPEWDEIIRRIPARPVLSDHMKEEEESAHGEISDEDHDFCGPWVSKGNPTGYLDSDDEQILDQWDHDWMVRGRRRRMTEYE